MTQQLHLDAPRSPLTEIADAISVIDFRFELTAVLNSLATSDAEQSRFELSNKLMDCFFVTYVADNVAAHAYNMEEESISTEIINQCYEAVKNVADNSVILPCITQALSQIQSQPSNE